MYMPDELTQYERGTIFGIWLTVEILTLNMHAYKDAITVLKESQIPPERFIQMLHITNYEVDRLTRKVLNEYIAFKRNKKNRGHHIA